MKQPGKQIIDVVRSSRESLEAASLERQANILGGSSMPKVEPKATAEPKDELSFKAVKVDDQGVLTLCASSIAKDGADESVQKGAMIGMAYDFCASANRTFKANHDNEVPIEAQLVESMVGAPILKSGKILPAGEPWPEDDPFVGINVEKGNESHWFISVRPTDPEVVKAAKEGKIVGASWGGMALKVED